MTLAEQINLKRKEIKTDGYPMSISEWISMYESEELDIHPEFQRFYRWSPAQKTSLIESILLGIPLPPIFVSQRNDGIWDVVDGLQRLSTVFQFVGILKDEQGVKIPPLALESTKYLPGLQDITWANEHNPNKALSKDLQLVIKRSKISASIILKESDETAKYDLFQRLNTGGSELSPQEVRNCLLVMINREFFNWLKELPRNEDFITTTVLTERSREESYDVELVLRFVLLSLIAEDEIKSIGDVGVFLTERISKVAEDATFELAPAKKLFEDTFSIINESMSEDAFKKYNSTKGRHEGAFLLSLFEVFTLGVAYNIANGTLCEKDDIVEKIRSVWGDADFTNWSGTGLTASRRLPKLIPYGRALFRK